ncbi:MAG: hypothetical protein ACXVDD_20020 [Polyangia bacterium]
MRSQARRLILVAALVAATAGCATTTAAPSTRLLMHVDTIDPPKLQQFEEARVRWVALLRTQHRSDRRGLYLKIGANTYYSLVSFARWRELETIGGERQKTVDALAKEAAEYERLCHEGLVFPHASEIWSEAPELSYVPTGRRLTDAVQVVIEDVRPTAEYEAAWKPIAMALLRAKYPVERRTFHSSYGSGRMLAFWLASSVAVLKAAPTLQQALTSVVGDEKAKALLDAWRACIVGSQTLDVEPKPEMSLD